MSIIGWLKEKLSNQSKAMSLYQRGMKKARNQDQLGAIDDYTDAIQTPSAPSTVVSMATLNRALAYVALGDFSKGVDDLTAVLEMDGAPAIVKKMARQKLAKRRAHNRRSKDR